MKKKALILTVWDAPNYGSFLQAMAMKHFLESNDYEVKFVQYRSDLEEKKFLFEKKKQLLFHPFFSIKRAYSFIKTHKEVEKVKLNCIKEDDYDLVLIGSDEIWNLRNDPYFSESYFYGDGFCKEKVVIFSVSVGTGKYEDFKDKNKILNSIKMLDGNVSVRDNATNEILRKINKDTEIKMTCDPTFLVDKEMYVREYKGKLPDDFIIVYSYKIPEKLKQNILRFAKENKLKIISLCNYYDFCDYNISCTPLEFSDIIKKCKYSVITTFHGTIYSIFNEANFVSATDKQKTTDVLKKVGLEGRQISEESSYEEFSTLLKQKIDYSVVNKKINELRVDSSNWLKERIVKRKNDN